MNILLRKAMGALGWRPTAKSETSKVRHLVLPYCKGRGADIGFGGDKIKPDAVGIDLPQPYTRVGRYKVDLPCDLMAGPIPVPDSYFDYVYSSHLIEDFPDIRAILREFVRILKSGGTLILVFPDQVAYEKYCYYRGEGTNPHHVYPDMGLSFMLYNIQRIPESYHVETLFASNCKIDYNVILVLKITK